MTALIAITLVISGCEERERNAGLLRSSSNFALREYLKEFKIGTLLFSKPLIIF